MDLRRYVDLYAAETQDNLRALQRSLLAIEGCPDDSAVNEAFRAVHTIKGMSAAMGYHDAATRAHQLEDRLTALRADRALVQPAEVDALLGQADALERDVAFAVRSLAPQPAAQAGDASHRAGPPSASAAELPPLPEAPSGTVHVLSIRFAVDAPLPAARAMIMLRMLQARPGLLGSRPEGDFADFDGVLHLFLGEAADPGALQAIALDAPDVESATVQVPLGAEQSVAPGDADGAAATGVHPRGANGKSSAAGAAPFGGAGRQVRVDERRLDALAEGIGELSVLRNRLLHADRAVAPTAAMIDRMGGLLGDLERAVLEMRMVPLAEVFDRLPRVVRDASRRTGKDVELEIRGETIELDRAILTDIGEPLVHLLRNAVDHGIETSEARLEASKPERGHITLTAERERSSVRIVLEDDGAGVNRARVLAKARAAGLLSAEADERLSDADLLRLLSSPGFSTAEQVSDVSGRGVGLDNVVNRIRALGGAVDMHTIEGAGTRFAIRLPITLALVRALRVRVAGEDYTIPLTHVTEALMLGETIDCDGRECVVVRDEPLPLVRLRALLQSSGGGQETAAVVAELGERRAALAVDELVGHEQILVKSFDPAPGTLPVFSGATLLDDGRPALVLDPLSVM
jgi:two-component system chemotaxis sensor kinase CheA